ncbi:NADH-quinone oxidoreductase subunit N [Paenibacillus abyssi]|uniref:NADH-quinone oxidoreductase subunit N n=1 Tax=Paenibacillus abyssi TaxID=1340531 RepID=A0A917CLH7_9BACL|nr:NADH-quinone oxidoreductase subunit N [Paenibacillus abyssi]GGF91762.1 NADH-quinone oxidoreductase subunit N [Paenibacillus abyssi]
MAYNDALGRLTWNDLAYLTPELTLVIAAILLTLIDLALPNRFSRQTIGWLSLSGLLLSLYFVVWHMLKMNPVGGEPGAVVRLLGDSYRIDDYASLMKIIFLVGAALIVLMSLGTVKRDDELPDKGEFYTLLLPAVLGAMIMASSGDLITIFVGMELLSITTYVLVGMRKKVTIGSEAAFKYVVIGGISSAIILFGMSYLYGVTGSTNLGLIALGLQNAVSQYPAFVYIAFFFMLGGLGMKIAAAPFHAWAPDVYQGASTPVTAFLAVISKAAALAVLFRIFYNTALFDTSYFKGGAAGSLGGDVFLAMKVLAVSAMIVGTTVALRQRNMKRMLALSGVANAGYLLVPISVGIVGFHSNNMSELLFYLIAYLFMNIGAFAVLAVVSRAAGHEELSGFAGLYYRAPWTAAAMIVMILSLAGLPVTGGFFGKLFILIGAAQMKDFWIVAIMVATSVISYYFYFSVIRQMFMRTSEGGGEIWIPVPTGLAIWICVGATIALGIFPNPVLDWLNTVFSLPGDLWVR